MTEDVSPKTTKQCPHCKSDIPLGAKRCPQCQSDLRNWFNRHPILTIFLAFILVIFTMGIIGGSMKREGYIQEKTLPKVTEAPQKTTPTKEATWQKVKSWKGTGIKNTEPFKISGKQWRIIWSNEDTSGFNASVLQIFVYKPNSIAPLELVANVQGTASDTSYIYKSGEFYLTINSTNSNWTLVVEELK